MAQSDKPRLRYYIGSNGPAFLVASILMLAAASYTQANLLFWSFGLLVGGLLVNALLSWLMLRGVTIQRILPQHAVAGEPGVIHYRIINRKRWLPVFNLVIAEAGRPGRWWPSKKQLAAAAPAGVAPSWVLHLGPGQSVLAEAPFWPARRGAVTFSRVEAWSSFPFGMVGRKLIVDQPTELMVYPHLFPVRRQTFRSLMYSDFNASKRLQQVGLSDEFFGLRDYQPGDRLRAINWKRTARTGKLVTKETSRPGVVRVMLLLDLTPLGAEAATPPPSAKPRRRVDFLGREIPPPPENPPDPDHPWVDAERTISLAASLICHAYAQGFPIGLAVLGAQCPTFRVHHSMAHRSVILNVLSRLDLARPPQVQQERLIHPTIIVRPRAAGPVASLLTGIVTISAGDLEHHLVDLEGGIASLLANTQTESKRRRTFPEPAWK